MPPAAPSRRFFARCLRWNQRGSTPHLRWLLTLSAFVAALAALTFSTHRNPGFNTPPAMGGDAVIYDSLGWELAAGRGFALDFRDPEFLEPYRIADPAGVVRLVESGPHGPIASRPPLLPLLLAGLNRALERQFYGLRVVNVVAMSAVAAMIVWTVARMAGPFPALLAFANYLIVDPRIRVTTREFLTEALACLLTALLTVTLVRFVERPRLATSLLAGLIFGAAMLLRTMFVLWIPVFVVLIWLAPRFARKAEGEPAAAMSGDRWSPNGTATIGVIHVATFLIAAATVFAPWGIRNCEILNRTMPLGTQGMMELSAGQGDAAFDRWGMWHNLEETGFYSPVDLPDQSSVERELARADWSWQQATNWRQSNWFKVIVLPFMKVFQEFRPHMSGDLYILAFALLGLSAVRGSPEGRVWRAMLLATVLGVAVTWSVAGRFIVPILYVLHCAAAIGLWQSLLVCANQQQSASPLAHTPDDVPRPATY